MRSPFPCVRLDLSKRAVAPYTRVNLIETFTRMLWPAAIAAR